MELVTEAEANADGLLAPDHVPSLWPLYTAHGVVAFGMKAWKFAVPLMLMLLAQESTLLPGALFIACQTVSCVLFCSALGRRLDQTGQRFGAAATAAIFADTPVVLSALPMLVLLWRGNTQQQMSLADGPTVALFGVLVVLGSVEAVASATLDVAVKKEWMVRGRV